MYKNVLIISDNSFLSEKFFDIIEKKKITECNFSFAVSPFSKKNNFKFIKSNKIKVFDLRDQKDIDFIKLNYDLIFSIHCKQIFPSELVSNLKCVNIHPGYNPINRGWYPQVFSIINNLPIGATIHEIDEKLDHGKIIDRVLVEKSSYDTSDSLYNKIIHEELKLLDSNIEKILKGNYKTIKPENEGNLFLKNDFINLLELNLDDITTVGAFIDKLRALTHGDYNNAFFIDEKTGRKIFVYLKLKPE